MFNDDFLRRIREQQEQMRRLTQPYEMLRSSIADQARTAAEQLKDPAFSLRWSRLSPTCGR